MALTQEEREERRRQNRRDERNGKSRMAGDELLKSREEKEAYRQSLLTDEELRNERIQNVKFTGGLTTLPDDYDPIKVVTALKGSWGQEDLARYNDLFGGGEDTTGPEEPTGPINDPATGVPTAPVDNGGDQIIKLPKNPIGGGIGGGATQIVQNDNDVTNSFNNSSNFSYTQDNSATQNVYGGSSRTFKYGGNDIGSGYDVDPQSPVKDSGLFMYDFMKRYNLKPM